MSDVPEPKVDYIVDFGDEVGTITVSHEQAKNEKEAVKIAKASYEDVKANLKRIAEA